VETFEQMLDRLRLLIQDADLRHRMSAAATSYAKQFDWDQIAAQWKSTFDRELRKSS
jgi:glycosyltransferase involved in cell wall biosynthesis